MPEQMIVWTAAGTVQCIYCKAEWIGTPEDDHADPCCMMWVMRWDHPAPPPATAGSVGDHDHQRRAASP